MKRIYYNCGIKIEINRRSPQINREKKKKKKKKRLYGIRTHDLCDIGGSIIISDLEMLLTDCRGRYFVVSCFEPFSTAKW